MKTWPDAWQMRNTAELIESCVLEIGDGYRAKNTELGETGLPFLRISNLVDYIDTESADILCEESVEKAGSKVSQPYDVVLTTKGSVGRFAFVKPGMMKFVYSPQLSYWRVLRRDVIDPRYLFYWMHNKEYTDQSQKVKGLTDMADYISLTNQRKMDITLPPFSLQRRISSVLSAYDDLIENNRRRIQILEELARALYQEWFVHFRFPGHEDVDMVDSELGEIPEGWKIKPYSDIADFVNGYAFKPQHWQKEGKLIVKIAEMKNGIGGSSSFYHGDDIPQRYHIDTGHLLFAWSASLCITFWTGGPALLNQHVFDVIPREGFSKDFMYHSLKHNLDRFIRITQGATMTHIRRSALDEVCIAIPSLGIRYQFDCVVGKTSRLLMNLQKQNRALAEARNLLLPKLVSGQIGVSDMKTEIPPDTGKTSKYSDQSTLNQWLDGDNEDGPS